MAMYIIRPTTITEAMLFGTDIPETDYAEWAVGTAYTALDYCIVAAQHKIYRALVNVTGGDSPEIDVTNTTPKWQEISATNRWKPFDAVIGTKASRATSATWVLDPGLIDSIAVLNVAASSIQIVLADQDQDVITNGTAWTGATGTTPPTGWTVESAQPTFTIDAGKLKIEAGAGEGGCNQTITVVPGTEMQLLFKYRNTAGDLARYRVYDVTNSASILTTTDLPDAETESVISYVFTVPAGCTEILIALLAKSAGDIVWFDSFSLSPTVYNTTTDMVSTINIIDEYTYFFEPIIWATSVTKLNLATGGLPPYPNATVTVTVTNTGGTAECGAIVPGLKLEIGGLQRGPKPGCKSYSTKTEDAFGNYTVTKRANKKLLSCQLWVKNTIIDFVLQQLALYDSELLVWVGLETYECLVIYGFWVSFDPSMDYDDFTIMDLKVEGVI